MNSNQVPGWYISSERYAAKEERLRAAINEIRPLVQADLLSVLEQRIQQKRQGGSPREFWIWWVRKALEYYEGHGVVAFGMFLYQFPFPSSGNHMVEVLAPIFAKDWEITYNSEEGMFRFKWQHE